MAGGKRLAPERFCFGSDVIPPRPAQFAFHPFRPQQQIGRIDWPEAEVVERRDDLIVAAGIRQRLSQAAGAGRRENDVKRSGRH